MAKTEPVPLTPLDERSALEQMLSGAYDSDLIVDDYEVSALGVFSGTAINEADEEAEILFRFDPATESIEFGGEVDEEPEDD